MRQIMDPNLYNNTRRIIFSTIHDPKKGFDAAFDYMERTYRTKLSHNSYTGLMAEIQFYKNYKDAYSLTVSADVGDHTDFSGNLDGKPTRFDVTTNTDFKDFEDYEPYMGSGIEYKIAHYDHSTFSLVDILDLRFEKCSCGGYLFPFILMKTENTNRKNEPCGSNDQVLIKICNTCLHWSEQTRWSHISCCSPSEFYESIRGINEEENHALEQLDIYKTDMYKTFRREINGSIMALAEHNYKITKPDGDGEWFFDFVFINRAVSKHFPLEVEVGLID